MAGWRRHLTKAEAKDLVDHLRKWDDVGAIGHIVLTLRQNEQSPGVGLLSYLTLGPEKGTPEHTKLTTVMDDLLDAIANRVVQH